MFDGTRDFFAHYRAHRAGKEFKIHHCYHDGITSDLHFAGDHSIFESGLGSKKLGFLRIVRKAEWVCRNEISLSFLKCVFVGNELEAVVGAHEEVVGTIGANQVVLLEVQGVQ